MAPNWTQCKLKRLLELFDKYYDNLFHQSASNYQRKLKKETFEKIANELDMPLQALKFKYFNLNNAYNAEIKKINAARNQGFFYRPTLPWFKEYKEIMEKVDELNKYDHYTVQNVEERVETPSPDENMEPEEESDLKDEDEASLDQPDTDTIVVSIKQECIDGVKKGNWDVDFVETVQSVHCVEPPKPIVIPPAPPALPQPAQLSRIAYVKKTPKRPHKPDSPGKVAEDEFQMFANHVAEQLRNMTIDSARRMQSEIHIIFDEEGFPFYSPVLDDI